MSATAPDETTARPMNSSTPKPSVNDDERPISPITIARIQIVRGFLVRPGSEFGLDGWVRVTVGPPPLMERFARELADVRAGARQ